MQRAALCQVSIDGESPAGTLQLSLSGELDGSSATGVRIQMATAIGAHRRVSVDLSGLTFLGASGLAVFVALHRAIRERGGTIEFRDPEPRQKQLFALTRLDHLLATTDQPRRRVQVDNGS